MKTLCRRPRAHADTAAVTTNTTTATQYTHDGTMQTTQLHDYKNDCYIESGPEKAGAGEPVGAKWED